MALDRRRATGIALLVWGSLGVVLIVLALLIGLDTAARTESLLSSGDRALRAAATSTRSAADALDGVEGGIGQATGSVRRAAGLAGDASATLDALADSMSLSILGSQPLLPLAGRFSDSADDAALLAEELEALGGSLETTGDDTARLTAELNELAAALEDGSASADADPPPLRLALVVLVAWIALPTLAALAAGAALASGRRLG